MLKLSLSVYSGAYIVVKGIVAIAGAETDVVARKARQKYERNKHVTFKNWPTFNDCISEIDNTQVDNANFLM